MKEELYTVTEHDADTCYRPSSMAWAVTFILMLDKTISKKKLNRY